MLNHNEPLPIDHILGYASEGYPSGDGLAKWYVGIGLSNVQFSSKYFS